MNLGKSTALRTTWIAQRV